MQSDVCLYPCNFFETFCLTALECQAAGLPVVTSEFGALATTLAPGAGVKIPRASEFAGISSAVRAGGCGRAAGRGAAAGHGCGRRAARRRRAVRLVGRGGAVAAVGVGAVTRGHGDTATRRHGVMMCR